MARATLKGRYLKWGHSYGIRLRKKDAERLAVRAGTDVNVTVDTELEPFDVDQIRTFRGAENRGSRDHDVDSIGSIWRDHALLTYADASAVSTARRLELGLFTFDDRQRRALDVSKA